jgi:ubiquinone/menaquinone biosynthesis C-methylase UbiE
MGESDTGSRHQGMNTSKPSNVSLEAPAADSSDVADHYARSGLIEAIEAGILQMGKTPDTVTIDDLAPADEFHIGGRTATEKLIEQLGVRPGDHVLDVGCGLGGPARFVAQRFKCRVSGIDLTSDYVETGNRLCEWVGLGESVELRRSSALSMPFKDTKFDAAYMLHVGMNIDDKESLCVEVSRVLRPGSRFAIYDVMRTAEGDLSYPLPWATTPASSAVAAAERYRQALQRAGFEILSERNRRDFALSYFNNLRSRTPAAGAPAPLGLHTLMGERRPHQIKNMFESISAGIIAPIELIARKVQ